jgi:hypothetical protein
MELSNAERASTRPSRRVTVTHVEAPSDSRRNSRDPVLPWKMMRSPSRA